MEVSLYHWRITFFYEPDADGTPIVVRAEAIRVPKPQSR